jgi:hypothetical protein
MTHERYSASGFPTQSRNAIDIPSASVYGMHGKLLFAVASNATEGEVGFEGFETSATGSISGATVQVGEGNIAYVEDRPCTQCGPGAPAVSITKELAHTGKRSMRLTRDARFEQPRLQLTPGKVYLISAWVSLGRAGSKAADVATYARGASSTSQVGLRVLAATALPPQDPNPVGFEDAGDMEGTSPIVSGPQHALDTFEPDGPIIDGWQRIEGTFVAPAAGETLWLQFLTGNGNDSNPKAAYFDDLRIQPEDASLKSFVYDPDTLRMTAQLDENNFATLYRYTPDGKMDLIRRETVRGILAQQEDRMHTREHP